VISDAIARSRQPADRQRRTPTCSPSATAATRATPPPRAQTSRAFSDGTILELVL